MTRIQRHAALAALALVAACSKPSVDQQEAMATDNAVNAQHDAEARAGALEEQADALANEANRAGGNMANALDARSAADRKAADAAMKEGDAQAEQIEDRSENALENKP